MKYSLKRIFRVLCLRIATHVPMDAHTRLKFVKYGGGYVLKILSIVALVMVLY